MRNSGGGALCIVALMKAAARRNAVSRNETCRVESWPRSAARAASACALVQGVGWLRAPL